jgi:hypothetical protein
MVLGTIQSSLPPPLCNRELFFSETSCIYLPLYFKSPELIIVPLHPVYASICYYEGQPVTGSWLPKKSKPVSYSSTTPLFFPHHLPMVTQGPCPHSRLSNQDLSICALLEYEPLTDPT